MSESVYPVLVYEYSADGYHDEPVSMGAAELALYLQANLKTILNERRELRITDQMDLMVFHVQDGKIIFDGENHYPEGKPLPEKLR